MSLRSNLVCGVVIKRQETFKLIAVSGFFYFFLTFRRYIIFDLILCSDKTKNQVIDVFV